MTNLTEKYKKRELKEGAYYVRNEHNVIFTAENYINYDCFNDTKVCDFYNVETNIVEVLAPVPSYEEWQSLNELVDCMSDTGKAFAHMLSPFTDDYFNGLTTKDIAELAKKSIRLTTQHCEDTAEIDNLKKLLEECRDEFSYLAATRAELSKPMIRKISEALK